MARVALVAAGVALGCVVAEGAFRAVMWLVPELQSFNPPPLVEDRRTDHALLAGITTRYLSPEREFDNVVVINTLGWHDRPRAARKSAGTYRVAVVGDSLVEGLQVPRDATLTARLEDRFARERTHGPRIEVLNAGISGMSPVLEYLLIRDRVLALEPDVILLALFMNDVSEDVRWRSLVEFDGAGRPIRLTATTSRTAFVPPPLKRFLQRHSRLAVFLTNLHHFGRVRPRRIYSEGAEGWTSGEPPGDIFAAIREPSTPATDAAWAFTLTMLEHTAALVRERTVGFAVVVVPAPNQVSAREWRHGRRAWRLDTEAWSPAQARVVAWGAARGVPVLDLLPALRRSEEFPLFFPFDGHFTPRGHEAAAEILWRFLRERPELLPR